MSIEFDADNAVVRITPQGVVTADVIVELITRLFAHPDFRPGMPSLWDYRMCHEVRVTTDELRQIGAFANANAKRRGRARLAVVAKDDLQFGLSRMFAMLSDMDHLDFVVFRDISSAEQWLVRPADTHQNE